MTDAIAVLKSAAIQTEYNSNAWMTLVHAAQHLDANAKPERNMVQDSEVVLKDGRVEFRIMVYRESPEASNQVEPVGLIEGMVSMDEGRMTSIAFTDAISAKTTELPLLSQPNPPRT